MFEWYETDPGSNFLDDVGRNSVLTDPGMWDNRFAWDNQFAQGLELLMQQQNNFAFPPGRELFWSPATESIVDGQGRTLLDAGGVKQLQLDTDALQRHAAAKGASAGDGDEKAGILERLEKTLEPINRFLGTRTGGALAMLGLSGAGLLIQNAMQGDPKPFTPPARTASILDNPAAMAEERRIREASLKGISHLLDPKGGSGDPITTSLTERLKKALAGEVSSPVLAKAAATEDEAFANRMARTYGPMWEGTPGARAQKQELADAQAIRAYMDNMTTIGQLEPRQAARLTGETQRNMQLSGITGFDAGRRHIDDLNMDLAYKEYLAEQQRRANEGRSIASLLSGIGYALGGRDRLPWQTQNTQPAAAGGYGLFPS